MPDQKLLSLDLPDLIRAMQPHIYGKGLQFAENAEFGGVSPLKHTKGGFHYTEGGRSAVDIRDWRPDYAPEYKGGPNVHWVQRTKNFRDRFQTLVGRKGPGAEAFGPGDRDHDSHGHWGMKGKWDFTPDSIAWLATGDPALRPKVQAALPSVGNNFRPANAAPAAAGGGGAVKVPSNADSWLGTIRFAEHGRDGPEVYSTMFGGGRFDPAKGHPNRVVRSGGYASAAAGAYQFMPDTWSRVSKQLGLKDFSPASQDRAARQLALEKGVNIDTDPLTPQNVAKLAPVWASLPNAQGRSAYNQPVRPFQELEGFFKGYKGPAGGGATGSSAGSVSDAGAETTTRPRQSPSAALAPWPAAPAPESWKSRSGSGLISSMVGEEWGTGQAPESSLDRLVSAYGQNREKASPTGSGRSGQGRDPEAVLPVLQGEPMAPRSRTPIREPVSQRMAGRRLLRSLGLDGGAA
jgi:muramidase (phage lysozyme)